MKTDELISALSADLATPMPTASRRWLIALPIAAVVVVGLHVSFFHLRPDFATALMTVRYAFKMGLMLVLAVCGFLALQEISRPTASVQLVAQRLLAAPILLLAGVMLEMAVTPMAGWHAAMMGLGDQWICLTAVPVMALAPMIAALIGLRAGAPTHPALAALAAGLFSGGFAAAIYALHCPNDSPMYVAVWYAGGITIASLVALAVAPRFTKW